MTFPRKGQAQILSASVDVLLDRVVSPFRPHFQPLMAGMSSPCFSMYSLCSISFSWIACLK